MVDIVKHPDVPDRDLFVFDTKTDKLVETVDTLGTLLYGLTVDSKGRVFIAQTDARNDVNGRAGTKKHTLKEMQNRAFLNQITSVSFKKGKAEKPRFINLEPLPPTHPKPGKSLATPFAIQVSADDSTLVVSAAGSDKLFTVDANSGKVLGRIPVGAVPRGIALESSKNGQPSRAWVFNAIANTVSVVDLSDTAKPKIAGFIPLKDPTDRQIKLGRTWFNDADASTTRTFSCASCHPDGHTDQFAVGYQDSDRDRRQPDHAALDDAHPRPAGHGPFHWDGVPGDPYGGINSASIRKHVPPNSSPDDPTSATRHVIDGGLASTMHLDGAEILNDEGKVGRLSAAERDDMARFLLNVPYPPAQRRAYDNVVSSRARQGFQAFSTSTAISIPQNSDPTSAETATACRFLSARTHREPAWTLRRGAERMIVS